MPVFWEIFNLCLEENNFKPQNCDTTRKRPASQLTYFIELLYDIYRNKLGKSLSKPFLLYHIPRSKGNKVHLTPAHRPKLLPAKLACWLAEPILGPHPFNIDLLHVKESCRRPHPNGSSGFMWAICVSGLGPVPGSAPGKDLKAFRKARCMSRLHG